MFNKKNHEEVVPTEPERKTSKEGHIHVDEPLTSYIFFRGGDNHKHEDLMLPNEQVITCFKTVRDEAIFTNLRIILRDVKGLGDKVETLIIPYKSILMFYVENAGIVDLDSDVFLWTRVGNIQFHLKRGIDTKEFTKMLSERIV